MPQLRPQVTVGSRVQPLRSLVFRNTLRRLCVESSVQLIPGSTQLLRMYDALASVLTTLTLFWRIIQGIWVGGIPWFPSTLFIFLTTCMTCHTLQWGLFLHDSALSVVAVPHLSLLSHAVGRISTILLHRKDDMLPYFMGRNFLFLHPPPSAPSFAACGLMLMCSTVHTIPLH